MSLRFKSATAVVMVTIATSFLVATTVQPFAGEKKIAPSQSENIKIEKGQLRDNSEATDDDKPQESKWPWKKRAHNLVSGKVKTKSRAHNLVSGKVKVKSRHHTRSSTYVIFKRVHNLVSGKVKVKRKK